MSKSKQYWGEITAEDDNFTPDVTQDIERSMSKFSMAIYKVDSDEEQPTRVENITLPPVDPLVMYAISLHKHVNDVTEMIRVAELAAELNLIPPEDAIPKVTPLPEIPILHKPNKLNYIPKDFTPFSVGEEVQVLTLSEAVVKQILSKTVAILFAHIGYESSHQSILDLMSDVLDSFLKKFCHHLKVAVEDSEEGRVGGFPHITEKVLTELGLGGVKGLHDYYQCRVVKYIDVLLKRCQEVGGHYKMLLVPKSPPPVDNTVFSVKVEDQIMSEENHEVHFATLDGGELGFTSLQTGYQLLNTLEAGEAEAAKLYAELGGLCWDGMDGLQDVDSMLDFFYSRIYDLFDLYVPMTAPRACNRYSPWFSKEIKNLVENEEEATGSSSPSVVVAQSEIDPSQFNKKKRFK